MNNLQSRFYIHFLYTLCILLATNATSCSCGNPVSQGTKSALPHTPDTNNPNTPSINEAIKQLEEEAQAPNADPTTKKIYEFISGLPPHKFFMQPDGRLTRISEEKNGHELLNKMLKFFPTTKAMPDALTWLVDKKLLDLNETDNQGKTSLEKILETWFDNLSLFSAKAKQIADMAVQKGAKISSAKAGSLLEKFLETLPDKGLDPKVYSELIDFLTKQNPHLNPLKAQQLEIQYFEKIINTKNHTEKHTELQLILDLLKTQAVPLSSEQATDLLKKAGSSDTNLLYSELLDLGADPNIEVTLIGGERKSLLEYAYEKKDAELFKEVVQNPKTSADTINKKDKNNFTLAMDLAYNLPMPGNTFKLLVTNPHLDINTLQGNKIGTVNYTLLDIMIDNCINTHRVGHEDQKLQQIAHTEEWLNVLKSSELAQHPNFFVTSENIAKATAKLDSLIQARDSYIGEENYYNKILEFAQGTVDFLKGKSKP
jgi:hypothetical protein